MRTRLLRKELFVTVTVAPSVTYRPPVWQRFWSVHTLLAQTLPVIDTLRAGFCTASQEHNTWSNCRVQPADCVNVAPEVSRPRRLLFEDCCTVRPPCCTGAQLGAWYTTLEAGFTHLLRDTARVGKRTPALRLNSNELMTALVPCSTTMAPL